MPHQPRIWSSCGNSGGGPRWRITPTSLQAFNGRDALRDAYEEALDLCQYLRQALYERDGR